MMVKKRREQPPHQVIPALLWFAALIVSSSTTESAASCSFLSTKRTAASKRTTCTGCITKNDSSLPTLLASKPLVTSWNQNSFGASRRRNIFPKEMQLWSTLVESSSEVITKQSNPPTLEHGNDTNIVIDYECDDNDGITWDDVVQRYTEYIDFHGHGIVKKSDTNLDVELYNWTQRIRKRYKHQYSAATSSSSIQATTASATTKTKRRKKIVHMLSDNKFQQLERIGFVWEINEAIWEYRYQQLCIYYTEHDHCNVPNTMPHLGVWVRNQRREYKRRCNDDSSTLTDERLHKLEAIHFRWYKSQNDTWETRYQQLIQYKKIFGHCNVPQPQYNSTATTTDADHTKQQLQKSTSMDADDGNSLTATNIQLLGQWCMNQRTLYRNREMYKQSNGLTSQRIEKLDAIGFIFAPHQNKWNTYLQQLVVFYTTHGHVRISATTAVAGNTTTCSDGIGSSEIDQDSLMQGKEEQQQQQHVDLQLWLKIQRYLYHQKRLSQYRITQLETLIPKFTWRARSASGPSTKDWSDLFAAMRTKGISPHVRPRTSTVHQAPVQNNYSDADLLELWNRDDDDDDE